MKHQSRTERGTSLYQIPELGGLITSVFPTEIELQNNLPPQVVLNDFAVRVPFLMNQQRPAFVAAMAESYLNSAINSLLRNPGPFQRWSHQEIDVDPEYTIVTSESTQQPGSIHVYRPTEKKGSGMEHVTQFDNHLVYTDQEGKLVFVVFEVKTGAGRYFHEKVRDAVTKKLSLLRTIFGTQRFTYVLCIPPALSESLLGNKDSALFRFKSKGGVVLPLPHDHLTLDTMDPQCIT